MRTADLRNLATPAAALALVLGLVLGLGACESGTQQDPSTIRLSFDGETCEQHPEVTTIDYELFELDGTSLQRVTVAACGDAVFEGPIEGADGPVLLRVWGFDEFANLQMKGECAGVELGKDTCAVETYTEPLKAEMRWDEDPGADYVEGTCEGSGVDHFDYQLIRITTREVVAEEEGVDCIDQLDLGEVRPENFILHVDAFASDGARLIDGANCIFGTSHYAAPSWCRLRIDG